MKFYRIGLIIIGVMMIIRYLIMLDYSDLRWSNNNASYLGIMAMLFVIISLIVAMRAGKDRY